MDGNAILTSTPAAAPPDAPAPADVARAAGGGRLVWSLVAARTVATSARANSPLRLLLPRARSESLGRASWAFTSTFGGGLLAGDRIALDVTAGPGTTGFLGTQASTKVYRSPGGRSSRQALDVRVEDGATCVVAPDPVTCFAGAVYEQRQRFELSERAGGLVYLDWLTSGRRAAGERWAFGRCASRTEISVGGRRIFLDSLLLDPANGPLSGGHRMGRFDCLALLVVTGVRLRTAADGILRFVAAEPVRRAADLVFSASPLADGRGVVLRVAGVETEAVGRWLRDRLGFVPELLGGDPWARKF